MRIALNTLHKILRKQSDDECWALFSNHLSMHIYNIVSKLSPAMTLTAIDARYLHCRNVAMQKVVNISSPIKKIVHKQYHIVASPSSQESRNALNGGALACCCFKLSRILPKTVVNCPPVPPIARLGLLELL